MTADPDRLSRTELARRLDQRERYLLAVRRRTARTAQARLDQDATVHPVAFVRASELTSDATDEPVRDAIRAADTEGSL